MSKKTMAAWVMTTMSYLAFSAYVMVAPSWFQVGIVLFSILVLVVGDHYPSWSAVSNPVYLVLWILIYLPQLETVFVPGDTVVLLSSVFVFLLSSFSPMVVMAIESSYSAIKSDSIGNILINGAIFVALSLAFMIFAGVILNLPALLFVLLVFWVEMLILALLNTPYALGWVK